MFKSILLKMRSRVRRGRMIVTIHAREEMYNDGLSTDDLEHAFLTGEIIERQWDDRWNEWKYVIAGECLRGRAIEIVAKLGHREDTAVITVYEV